VSALDAARELVERTRRAQGLPETVEDVSALGRVAAVLDNGQQVASSFHFRDHAGAP